MAALKITSTNKEYIQSEGGNALVVSFVIIDDKDQVEYKRIFPLESTPEAIKAELSKALETYLSEKKQAEKQRIMDEKEDAADATLAELTDFQLEDSIKEKK